MAADQAENWFLATHLPFDVQRDALEKIMRLSFQRDGTPEKFIKTVAETLASANVLYAKLAPNFWSGSRG